MISKPPSLGSQSPEEWIKEFLGYFETLRFEFMRAKALWFPAQSNDVHGNHPGEQLTAGTSAYISFIVPREIGEVKEAVIRFIPTTSGTIDWTATISYAAKNEDEAAATATKTADGLAVTDDRMTEIDITSVFAAIEADDQVGVKITLDAVATTTNIYVLGLYFKYR